MVGMTNGDGQGIRRIGAFDQRAGQQSGDHRLNLNLIRVAGSHDSLLDRGRCVLRYGQPGLRRRQQNNTARLAKFQRAAGIAVKKSLFHSRFIKFVGIDNRQLPGVDRRQPCRQGVIGGRANRA